MAKTVNFPMSASLTFLFALAAAALFAGCVSYNTSQLSAMSSVELCELREIQGMNLSDDTRRTLQGELQRRNDSCANHAAALAERRQAFMQREMYGKHDDP